MTDRELYVAQCAFAYGLVLQAFIGIIWQLVTQRKKHEAHLIDTHMQFDDWNRANDLRIAQLDDDMKKLKHLGRRK